MATEGQPLGGSPPGGTNASLGRFAPESSGSPMVEVHLLRLPLQVMQASREHHDGLMREFRILALSGQVGEQELPVRLVELVGILGQRYGTSRERRDAELEAAIRSRLESVDQVELVPANAAQAAAGLGALMDEADSYCRQALLMTVPRPPTLRRFGEWYLQQYVDQVAGRPPVPWDGPLQVEG